MTTTIMHRYRIGNGPWQQLDRASLTALHTTLPLKVQIAKAMPSRPRSYDRDCGLLMALSLYCWGGLGKNLKGKGWATREYAEDYDFHFYINLLRAVDRFDPNKGNWASQVGWCAKAALRDLARQINKVKAVDEQLKVLLQEVNTDQDDSWETTEEPSENEVQYV